MLFRSLRDQQGVPRICFGLTDVEAADGVGLHRVDDLNTEALLLKSGKKSEPVVSGGLHCKGNLVKRQLGLAKETSSSGSLALASMASSRLYPEQLLVKENGLMMTVPSPSITAASCFLLAMSMPTMYIV